MKKINRWMRRSGWAVSGPAVGMLAAAAWWGFGPMTARAEPGAPAAPGLLLASAAVPAPPAGAAAGPAAPRPGDAEFARLMSLFWMAWQVGPGQEAAGRAAAAHADFYAAGVPANLLDEIARAAARAEAGAGAGTAAADAGAAALGALQVSADAEPRIVRRGSRAEVTVPYRASGRWRDGRPLAAAGELTLTWENQAGLWRVVAQRHVPVPAARR